jgi:hypothetical protein
VEADQQRAVALDDATAALQPVPQPPRHLDAPPRPRRFRVGIGDILLTGNHDTNAKPDFNQASTARAESGCHGFAPVPLKHWPEPTPSQI